MKINHIALWVKDLEVMKDFYERCFGAKSTAKYVNEVKNFQSYFLSFDDGCRLELMHKPNLVEDEKNGIEKIGLVHIAFSVGTRKKVDELTKLLNDNHITVVGNPRLTGDGCYESVILDPENNIIEITE